MNEQNELILSLYPTSHGLAYACLEMPQNLKDSGVITVYPICNDWILERIKKFVAFFKPTVIVVKGGGDTYSRGSKRIENLVESITKYAEEIKVPVFRYSRQQIKDVFEIFEAKTKYEIAHQIITWIPHLKSHAPKMRGPWRHEDYRMAVFDAVSLAISHKYLTE